MSALTALYIRIKNNRFAQDSFWALLGNVVAKGMSLLGSVLVARFLGKELFGEFGTIKSTLMNLAIFSTFGLGYTATKYIAENVKKRPEILKALAKKAMLITAIVSGVMAVLLFGYADWISSSILKASHLALPLRMLSLWLVFNALTTTQVGILAGLGEFKSMARINAYVGVLAFFASVALTYFWMLEGALLALLITQVFNWFLNYSKVNDCLSEFSNSNINGLNKELIRFSLPVTLQEGLYAITSWLAVIFLLNKGGFSEVGIYTAAIQWGAVLLFIPGILRNVILNHLAEKNNDRKSFQKVFKRTTAINLISTALPAFVIIICIPLIIELYGNDYNNLRMVLIVVSLTTILQSQTNVFSQAYLSLGKNWEMFILRIIRSISLLGTFLLVSDLYDQQALLLVLCSAFANSIFLILCWVGYKNMTLELTS